MGVPFDTFISAFLEKITSYDYVDMTDEEFNAQVDSFLIFSCAKFENIFRRRTGRSFYDRDMESRMFNWDLSSCDSSGRKNDLITIDEVVDIVSEGMVLRWLDSFVYSGDSLDLGNFLQTKDFIPYSPSSFLGNLNALHSKTRDRYEYLIREFSVEHGPLHRLHM